MGILIDNAYNGGKIEVNTPTGYPSNMFYDLETAIQIMGGSDIAVNGCEIRSSQNKDNARTSKGGFGVLVSTPFYNRVSITNNNLYNLQDNIWFSSGIDRTTEGTVKFGILDVSNNTIAATLPGAPTVWPGQPTAIAPYSLHGIQLDAIIYGSEPQPLTICKQNTLSNVAYGLKVSGLRGTTVQNNTITLQADPYASMDNEQYGINIENIPAARVGCTVENNNITGYDITANTTGILLSQATRVNLGCNTVGDNQHGFRFVGNNPQTKFWDNTMLISNKYGFTLDNQGVIDQQGDDGFYSGQICTSNNSWESGPGSWPSGHFMTYTMNLSLPAQSPFVILENPLFPEVNPKLGNSDVISPIRIYSNINGLIEKPTSSPTCDDRCGGANRNYNRTKTLLEEIADGTILLPNDDPDERLMVMQQQLYDLLNANPNLLVSSNSLQQFMLDNHWSNLDFIHYAARYVATGQYDKVALLLGVWPGQSPLDSSYYQYFDWLVQMHDNPRWQPLKEDILSLANKCPIKYGLVVYAVRNLFNALNGEIIEFENTCEPELEAKGGTRHTKTYDFIRLKKKAMPIVKFPSGELLVYPNPANNVVNISFKKMVTLEIIDVAGRRLLNNRINNSNVAKIDVSSFPRGIYLVKVTSAEGVVKTNKIIINRP